MPVDELLYPVNLVLRDRACLVVGGGTVAARKVQGLLAAGARVHVVASQVGPAIRALAEPGPAAGPEPELGAGSGPELGAGPGPGSEPELGAGSGPELGAGPGSGPELGAGPGPRPESGPGSITLAERPYEPADLSGMWLVVSATDDPAVNAAVRADADAAKVWVNAADDPPSCSFTLPAVVRQGPVMVAVSTSGQSPALAAWIKGLIEGMIGPEFATLALLLGQARAALQAEGRSTEAVDWRPALNSDMLDEIRAGDLTRARKRLEACLSSSLE